MDGHINFKLGEKY